MTPCALYLLGTTIEKYSFQDVWSSKILRPAAEQGRSLPFSMGTVSRLLAVVILYADALRYGKYDQLGFLNRLTDEVVLEAAKEIKTGTRY